MNYFFIANWKMNFDLKIAQEFCHNLTVNNLSDQRVIIAAPNIYLASLIKGFPKLCFASQDVSTRAESFGAFTGEISSSMLAQIGVSYAIIGHSERRRFFHENDNIVKIKAENCIEHNITPIICIGENHEQREKGDYLKFLKYQLINSLPSRGKDIIIAYEPVWSIGTGQTPELDQIEEVSHYILNLIAENGLLEHKPKLVYGGSVSSKNIKNFIKMPGISGVLVGNSSLNIEEFLKVCKAGE